MKSTLLKESSIYLGGELISKALPFLLLPYLTRALGTEGFGELSYYMVWLALISIGMSMSQEGAIARYYYFYGRRALPMVMWAGYLMSGVVALILMIIAISYGSAVGIYLTLIALLQTALGVQLSLRQCQRQSVAYITIQSLFSLSNVALTLFFLHVWQPTATLVNDRLLAMLLANGIAFMVAIRWGRQTLNMRIRPSFRQLRLGLQYILAFGVPLIFHHLSFFVKGQVDRFFIYQHYESSELGVYSAGVQLAAILPILLMAVNKALLPHFYGSLKRNQAAVRAKLPRYFVISLGGVCLPAMIAAALPNSLYLWFLGEHYGESQYYTVFYLLGYGLTVPYLIVVNYLFYLGLNKQIAAGSLMSAVVYLGLLLIFGQFSMQWIPFALIISNLFLIGYLVRCVKKH